MCVSEWKRKRKKNKYIIFQVKEKYIRASDTHLKLFLVPFMFRLFLEHLILKTLYSTFHFLSNGIVVWRCRKWGIFIELDIGTHLWHGDLTHLTVIIWLDTVRRSARFAIKEKYPLYRNCNLMTANESVRIFETVKRLIFLTLWFSNS